MIRELVTVAQGTDRLPFEQPIGISLRMYAARIALLFLAVFGVLAVMGVALALAWLAQSYPPNLLLPRAAFVIVFLYLLILFRIRGRNVQFTILRETTQIRNWARNFVIERGLLAVNVEQEQLVGQDLSGRVLCKARLEGANLSYHEMRGVNLSWARLAGADLIETHLEGARLVSADLRGARLTYADLAGADLRQANLNGAILLEANLAGVQFVGTDLSGADLTGAILTGVNFQNARVAGACFVKVVGLDDSQVEYLIKERAIMEARPSRSRAAASYPAFP